MYMIRALRCSQQTSFGHEVLAVFKRYLNSSETATALRPFYFIVHPDLFGRHPKERLVNEHSLKILHEYVANLKTQQSYTRKPIDLVFYIRDPNNQKSFKDIKISLQSTDIRKTVSTILQSCGLPLDYINTVPVQQKTRRTNPAAKWYTNYDVPEWNSRTEPKYKAPAQRSLRKWLEENYERVQRYQEASRQTQSEIDSLCERIVARVGVQSVRWENIWGNRHYIACLRTFSQLSEGQPARMRNTLQGRTLIFGNETGVNLHGEIVLGSEDVTTEWINLLKSVHAYDPMIERLPRMEQELSRLLNNIQIMRRQKREFVMAQNYEVLLNKMLNSLRRCQHVVVKELGDQDLSHLNLVVECESGPLALSNCGQFLIPASIPGTIMLKFIVENIERAATFLIDAKLHTFYMDQILDQCNNVLNVSSLQRDDAITPQQMTKCCQRLLDNQQLLNPLLQGTRLKVSTYYTVMKDGEITIPWNWI
ncbi:T-cell activation inhibitor, mitochondrial-like isoform X2 [Mercenaria mercenaria]|uniref:T-cell activation inhibitor, mitochondrial-like isoform X2 n=1 Tax=Mercenaria mercenaria TaxID=6596 RepID=UPI00234EC542|nr:T-cell activation inhibitor, mitochondrial-like isoform X2 [Mercenaria mercenaria]